MQLLNTTPLHHVMHSYVVLCKVYYIYEWSKPSENNTSYDDSYDSDDNNYGRTTPKMSETDERAITPPQFNNNIHNTVFTVKVSNEISGIPRLAGRLGLGRDQPG